MRSRNSQRGADPAGSRDNISPFQGPFSKGQNISDMIPLRRLVLFLSVFLIVDGLACRALSQDAPALERGPWVPDVGQGEYRNPIIFADYSDPDVCRKGRTYYLVASSFTQIPGLPILESKDLVNWKIVGHALKRLPPYHHYESVHPGDGVWAPAIRFHDGKFFVYYPDPDYGMFLVTAANPRGPWSKPVLVMGGKGFEDPCPFWDSDGKAYLIHAFAGSRAGIKSVLVLDLMNSGGTRVVDNGAIVYDGHGVDPTIEGPKLYKRKGYYYIFAPAGGVTDGWQVVLRSKNIYGPYERRVVLHQGNTSVNGPHQGAWVETPGGQSWFIHFQDRGAYGRVDYLEPMRWNNGWPEIGKVRPGNTIGEPVLRYRRPHVGKNFPVEVPQTSDEFNEESIGLQWQWQANPQPTWAFPAGNLGFLRLYAIPDCSKNFWTVPNILSQKFPAEIFTATAKLTFAPLSLGDRAGLIVLGSSYASLSLEREENGLYMVYAVCEHADRGKPETLARLGVAPDSTVYLRVSVSCGAVCRFSYSYDGRYFIEVPGTFTAKPGRWIGAKLGIFCVGKKKSDDSGYADFDWFRVR